MKRYRIVKGIGVISCIIFVTVVMVFGNRKAPNVSKITGRVKEVGENHILVSEDDRVGNIFIAYSQLSGDLDLQVSDRVEIEFEGEILETSPAMIGDKDGITIRKLKKSETGRD